MDLGQGSAITASSYDSTVIKWLIKKSLPLHIAFFPDRTDGDYRLSFVDSAVNKLPFLFSLM
jgi:hypothetical protein